MATTLRKDTLPKNDASYEREQFNIPNDVDQASWVGITLLAIAIFAIAYAIYAWTETSQNNYPTDQTAYRTNVNGSYANDNYTGRSALNEPAVMNNTQPQQ